MMIHRLGYRFVSGGSTRKTEGDPVSSDRGDSFVAFVGNTRRSGFYNGDNTTAGGERPESVHGRATVRPGSTHAGGLGERVLNTTPTGRTPRRGGAIGPSPRTPNGTPARGGDTYRRGQARQRARAGTGRLLAVRTPKTRRDMAGGCCATTLSGAGARQQRRAHQHMQACSMVTKQGAVSAAILFDFDPWTTRNTRGARRRKPWTLHTAINFDSGITGQPYELSSSCIARRGCGAAPSRAEIRSMAPERRSTSDYSNGAEYTSATKADQYRRSVQAADRVTTPVSRRTDGR